MHLCDITTGECQPHILTHSGTHSQHSECTCVFCVCVNRIHCSGGGHYSKVVYEIEFFSQLVCVYKPWPPPPTPTHPQTHNNNNLTDKKAFRFERVEQLIKRLLSRLCGSGRRYYVCSLGTEILGSLLEMAAEKATTTGGSGRNNKLGKFDSAD